MPISRGLKPYESKTPGKFKKSTYLNSYKKGQGIPNLASAKQMLNQSNSSALNESGNIT